MRFQVLVFWFVMLGSGTVAAQASNETGAAQGTLDPAFAAQLLAEDAAPVASTGAVSLDLNDAALPTVPSGSGLSRTERRSARSGRWLMGPGLGITLGSVVGGAVAGRPGYCSYHEVHYDRTAPRVTSAVLGSIGLALLVAGATKFFAVPKAHRELARARAGQRFGLGAAAFGLAAMSAGLVWLSSLPESTVCWST